MRAVTEYQPRVIIVVERERSDGYHAQVAQREERKKIARGLTEDYRAAGSEKNAITRGIGRLLERSGMNGKKRGTQPRGTRRKGMLLAGRG